MKKRIVAILVALAIAVMIPTSAFAAEVTETLPDPGMTPTNGFYFMETWMQRLNMAFTFGAKAKVEKALHYAGEKLAEMEAMAEHNQAQRMERAATQYRYYLNLATRNMKQAMVGGNETSEQVVMMMSRHIAAMTNNQNCGSEDCQQIRLRTREQAEECQENAVRDLARRDPEEALRLNLALMEQQCLRMNNCIGQEDNSQTEETLQQYERLRLMNNEILACAQQLGEGPEAQQMINEAMSNQSGVLSRVRDQLQIGNEGSAESPLQNQTQEQEQNGLESSGVEEPAQGQYGDGSGYSGGDGAGSSSGQKP